MGDLQFATVVIVTGLIVVFIVLFLLILLIQAISFFGTENKNNNKSKTDSTEVIKAKSEPISTEAPQLIVEEGISNDIIAVISAAVATLMGESSSKGFALKSVKRSKEARPVWSMAGIADNTRPF